MQCFMDVISSLYGCELLPTPHQMSSPDSQHTLQYWSFIQSATMLVGPYLSHPLTRNMKNARFLYAVYSAITRLKIKSRLKSAVKRLTPLYLLGGALSGTRVYAAKSKVAASGAQRGLRRAKRARKVWRNAILQLTSELGVRLLLILDANKRLKAVKIYITM